MGALGAPESLLPLEPIFELLVQFVFEHALHKVPILMSKLHFKKKSGVVYWRNFEIWLISRRAFYNNLRLGF